MCQSWMWLHPMSRTFSASMLQPTLRCSCAVGLHTGPHWPAPAPAGHARDSCERWVMQKSPWMSRPMGAQTPSHSVQLHQVAGCLQHQQRARCALPRLTSCCGRELVQKMRWCTCRCAATGSIPHLSCAAAPTHHSSPSAPGAQSSHSDADDSCSHVGCSSRPRPVPS